MGLFRRNKEIGLFNPVTGKVVALDEVHDEMFASKVMGDGFGVFPDNGEVYSPVKGIVTAIFPTKHAISLITINGTEVLVHMGIDTVELNGNGFEIFVKVDDKVDQETLLAKMDLAILAAEDKQSDTIIIFTNSKDKKVDITLGQTQAKEKVGSLE